MSWIECHNIAFYDCDLFYVPEPKYDTNKAEPYVMSAAPLWSSA